MDFKNKINLIFAVIALFLGIALIIIVVNAVSFAKNVVQNSLLEPQKNTAAQKFQFEKLKEIGIIKNAE